MADINIERKRRSVLPWIAGLIVLALLVYALAQALRTEDEPQGDDTAEVLPPTTEVR